jgi:hypothetical protein
MPIAKANQSESDPANRQANGRFGMGNKGGPGNPYNGTVQKLRAAMVSAVSEEDIRAVIGKVLDQAKEGNLAAVKLLLSYTIGQPHQTVQPDRVDLDALEIQDQSELKQALIDQRADFRARFKAARN